MPVHLIAKRCVAGHVGLALALALGVSTAGAAGRGPASRSSHATSPWTRPPGLVQAGNSKTPCVTVSLDALPSLDRATGIDFECVGTYATSAVHWSDWTDPWIIRPQYGYTSWVAADPTKRTLVIALNLIPSSLAKTEWRRVGASGRYDHYARQLAENLVSAGLGSSVIRLGQEMNGPWELDWVGKTALQQSLWARYFAHVVTAMRSVPGAHFLFDWNVNAGYQNISLDRYYPGDAYVDIVGADAYDEAPIHLPPAGSPDRWATLVSEPLGLTAIYKFARAHHKPFSIPEWGTVRASGNDPSYVTAMGRFVAAHFVAYQSWFDSRTDGILPLDRRVAAGSLAAYVRSFGPGSPAMRAGNARAYRP